MLRLNVSFIIIILYQAFAMPCDTASPSFTLHFWFLNVLHFYVNT